MLKSIQVIHLAIGAAMLAGSPAMAAPIVLDDFSATQSVPSGGNGTVVDGGILGGERDVIANGVGTTFNAAGGLATMSTTGTNFVLLDYDGLDASTAASFLLGPVDLTGGGMNDRFLLDVTAVTGTVQATVRIADTLSDIAEASFNIPSAGLFELLFADLTNAGLGESAASVDRVFLRLNFDPNEAITINQFSVGSGQPGAVPEPSSVALFGLGLCGLAAWRKRRQSW